MCLAHKASRDASPFVGPFSAFAAAADRDRNPVSFYKVDDRQASFRGGYSAGIGAPVWAAGKRWDELLEMRGELRVIRRGPLAFEPVLQVV